jgi:mRNA-degrading endonuclease RelE of RelBE toxin-antitoxin system
VRYQIEWRPRARKAFLALDKPVRRRIGEAVDALATDPRPAAAKMITGAHGVLALGYANDHARVIDDLDRALAGDLAC